MNLAGALTRGLARRRRLAAYRRLRAELEGLTDRDLADMGARRWQLGSMARRKALG